MTRFGQDLPFRTPEKLRDHIEASIFFQPRYVALVQIAKATNIKGEPYKSLFLNKSGADKLSEGSPSISVYPRYFTDNLVNIQFSGAPNQFHDASWGVNIDEVEKPESNLFGVSIERFQVYDGSKSVLRPSKEVLPGYKAEVTKLLDDPYSEANIASLNKALDFKKIDERLITLQSLTLPIRVEAVMELQISDGTRYVNILQAILIMQIVTFRKLFTKHGKGWYITTKIKKNFADCLFKTF